MVSLRHIRLIDAEAGPESGIAACHSRVDIVVGGDRAHAWMQGPYGSGQQLVGGDLMEAFGHVDDAMRRVLDFIRRLIERVERWDTNHCWSILQLRRLIPRLSLLMIIVPVYGV